MSYLYLLCSSEPHTFLDQKQQQRAENLGTRGKFMTVENRALTFAKPKLVIYIEENHG
jgi:hypothetical protein